MTIVSTVVVCAHNEEAYIETCLKSIGAQTVKPSTVILVLDRCADRTGELARPLLRPGSSTVIEKTRCLWKNSISENLELARKKGGGDALVVVDADISVPPKFLEVLVPQLNELASVSAVAETDPTPGLLNRLVWIWERTYRLAPLGEQQRGGCRAISTRALAQIGGFHDVASWDTDIDRRLKMIGLRTKLDHSVTVLHRRKMTFDRSISYQISAGRARKELHIGLGRTLLHSLVRLRPFVIYGYLKER